jgi:hypothetical protein
MTRRVALPFARLSKRLTVRADNRRGDLIAILLIGVRGRHQEWLNAVLRTSPGLPTIKAQNKIQITEKKPGKHNKTNDVFII